MTRAPDIAGLVKFARSVDRRLTEFFVGRERELEIIRGRVADVARLHRSGEIQPGEGSTVLITGVPGAGKTSLMARLRRKWNDPEGSDPIGVEVGLSELESPESIAGAVLSRLPGSAGNWLARHLTSFNLVVLPVGAGAGLREKNSGVSDIKRPVVLFIDEIQNISDDRTSNEVRLLTNLHLGTGGAPIVPVLAGLAHARDILDDAGLSRLSEDSILPLGALSSEEACQSAELFLEAFHVVGERTGWPETVARWSDGWPMHVHNTLRALADELAGCDGDLDRVDRTAVKKRAAISRTNYYRQRTAGALENHPILLGNVMEGIGQFGLTKPEVLNLIREQAGGSFAEIEDAEAVFRAMLAKGLIHGTEEHEYVCPIPSMRSWCAAFAGNRMHRLAMRGDYNTAKELLEHGMDPNHLDVRGRTPLHIACEENWPEIAKALLEAGADTEIADRLGRTPSEIVVPGGEIARMLTRSGT